MRFRIEHENSGRMRIHVLSHRMDYEMADTLLYYLNSQKEITQAKVYDRTGDAVLCYTGDRENIIKKLQSFSCGLVEIPDGYLANSGRELANQYQERLVMKVLFRYAGKWFLPYPLRFLYTACQAACYVVKGLKCLAKGRIEVPVLDGAAIGISMLRGDMNTAASVMFMLGIGELLEDWTHKKSVDDLARMMSLNINRVWLWKDGREILVPASDIRQGDKIVVHMGNVIPFDGIVYRGEAMVNQSSLTGESVPIRKWESCYAYAGTVVEEGELTIQVKTVEGASRFEKIVAMIEESEKLKSGLESKAEHLADRLVPYSLGTTALTWLLTGNATKALSILMVDFSCALKLAMPISVLSAIREASTYRLTVKGGKYLEAVAEADTVVFDKTGTLTKAQPMVVDVVSFNGDEPDELLRIAACLEEHFPHSMAKAVVDAAKNKNIEHEEMHSKVEYIVAHGIASMIDRKRVIIGSAHFAFEDENVVVPPEKSLLFEQLPQQYSHLYLAIEGQLAAVICIADPLREEAGFVVSSLKQAGISKVVMMTGDSERTAAAIAEQVGVDEYYSEVLPEDKAGYIRREREAGRKVIMIGDGMNDSPALSAADVGIAICDGAEIAREIADIIVGSDDLYPIVTLKMLGDGLMKRIHKNYRTIVGFNAMLILLGMAGILQPSASAFLHNMSTLAIGIKSMDNLLPSS